jgi:hypothetical protein
LKVVHDKNAIPVIARDVVLKGYTDVIVLRDVDQQYDIFDQGNRVNEVLDKMDFLVELKSAFGCLIKDQMQPKDQAIGECYAAGMMLNNLKIVKGCLTDLFVIVIIFRVPTADKLPPKFYISDRVINSEDYLLLLMLLMCNLTDNEVSELVQGSETVPEVADVSADKENLNFDPTFDFDPTLDETDTGEDGRKRDFTSFKSQGRMRTIHLNYSDEADRCEIDLTDLIRWETLRSGRQYLDESTLKQHTLSCN